MKVFIPMISRSGNYFKGHHWGRRDSDKKRWLKAIRLIAGEGVPSSHKVVVKITSIRKRLIDKDNLVSGMKGLIDSLKKLNWIIDDSPKHIELIAGQEPTMGKEAGTWIHIF